MFQEPMPKADLYLRYLNTNYPSIPRPERELVTTLRFALTEVKEGREPNQPTLDYLWNKIAKSECWNARYGGIMRRMADHIERNIRVIRTS